MLVATGFCSSDLEAHVPEPEWAWSELEIGLQIHLPIAAGILQPTRLRSLFSDLEQLFPEDWGNVWKVCSYS